LASADGVVRVAIHDSDLTESPRGSHCTQLLGSDHATGTPLEDEASVAEWVYASENEHFLVYPSRTLNVGEWRSGSMNGTFVAAVFPSRGELPGVHD
jgi:hypothetical protein